MAKIWFLLTVLSFLWATFLFEPFLAKPLHAQEDNDTSYEMKVLNMAYYPLVGGRLDQNITGLNWDLNTVRGKVEYLTSATLEGLNSGSKYHAYKDSVAEPSLSYSILENKEFFEAMPMSDYKVPWNDVGYRPDYRRILDQQNICDYVDNKGVKEVWIWGYHYGRTEPVESNMSMGFLSRGYWNRGTYGDVSNSEGTDDLPVCNHTYTLYNYNYAAPLGSALEDHTHQIEALMSNTDPKVWSLYVGGTGQMSFYRCGWTHYPPNMMEYGQDGISSHEYDWDNERFALSDCENWEPTVEGGLVESVDCHDWSGDNCSMHDPESANYRGAAFKIWWMQNIPGRGNQLVYQGRSMRNWWDFVGDFDTAINNRSFVLHSQGDVNGDGLVDWRDLTVLVSSFWTGDVKANLNLNDFVDLLDYNLLLKNWLY